MGFYLQDLTVAVYGSDFRVGVEEVDPALKHCQPKTGDPKRPQKGFCRKRLQPVESDWRML